MTVIDKPDVDTVILDETILDKVLPCVEADAGASWLWRIKCCGEPTYLCDVHEERARQAVATAAGSNAMCVCGLCGHKFGFHPKLDDIYWRAPI